MTLTGVVAGLVLLAAVDGLAAGFRASTGRTGLLRRRRTDWSAAARGLALAAAFLAPVVLGVVADATARDRWEAYRAAGAAMLTVYLPYAALVLACLLGYAVLDWRRRFLAMALVLGPFTLARPLVAVAGGLLAVRAAHDPVTGGLALASVAAVLLVEPVAGALWHRADDPADHLCRSHPSSAAAQPASNG